MRINIHVTISSNSLRYFEYMKNNYDGLCSSYTKLDYYCYCLDKVSFRRLKLLNNCIPILLKFGRGSEGHASAIEFALKNGFIKNEINIISDTDVVILMKDWDLTLEKLLLGKNPIGILGTRLEGINGFSTGNTKYQQYKNKPSTTWLAISPNYNFKTLRVMPDKKNFIKIDSLFLTDLYQLPYGYFVVKDTGWQIPSFLNENKIPFEVFDLIKPFDKKAIVLRGCSPYHDEFHFNGEPFLVHQRGSMKHYFRLDKLSIDFYNACDRYLGNPKWIIYPNFKDKMIVFYRDFNLFFKKSIKSFFNLLQIKN